MNHSTVIVTVVVRSSEQRLDYPRWINPREKVIVLEFLDEVTYMGYCVHVH
jgi:hypothetical protein